MISSRKKKQLDSDREFDVIIIGGGIQGATLAWECARHRLRTLLLEQADYGSQTSANNLKVIHGGIRYLQNFNFHRSIRSIRERDLLLKIAPHQIQPLSCLTAVAANLKHNVLTYSAAAWIYNTLSHRHGLCHDGEFANARLTDHKRIELPIANALQTKSFLQWQDGQVRNSERLVYSFIRSAEKLGAVALNYSRVEDIDIQRRQIIVNLLTENRQVNAGGRFIVDARGPWQNRISRHQDIRSMKYVQGINLVFPTRILEQGLGVRLGKGRSSRLIFACPWNDATLMGTWYFPCDDSPTGNISEEKIRTCLADVKSIFPDARLQADDVTLVHSGCLPADGGVQNDPYVIMSDKDTVQCAHYQRFHHGYISVSGVKYTSARELSSKVLKEHLYDGHYRDTSDSPNSWRLYGAEEMPTFEQMNTRFAHLEIDRATLNSLLYRYGDQCQGILEMASRQQHPNARITGNNTILKAEIDFVIANEDVYTLSDLLIRRTGIASTALPAQPCIEYCANTLQQQFHWTREQTHHNILELVQRFRIPFS